MNGGRGPIRIRFWGVRGSHPVCGPSTSEVGGNTSCVEVEVAGRTVIFDAGTGIIPLGRDLLSRSQSRLAHIFLSHVHHDHIGGFYFFEPSYSEEWRCFVYGYGTGRDGLTRVLNSAMRPPYFPITMRELPAQLSIRTLGTSAQVVLTEPKPAVLRPRAAVPADAPVVAARHIRAHPKPGVTLYRVSLEGRTVVYASDVEAAKGAHAEIASFARGADVLIHDAHWVEEEYSARQYGKVGWGHSTVQMAASVAKAAAVGELILFHHAPTRSDAEVARMEREARSIFPLTRAAREGMELQLR